MPKKWIKSSIKPENKGKFKAKAEDAGESTAEFAEEKEHAPGKLGMEAREAKTLMNMHHKPKSRGIMGRRYGKKEKKEE